MLSGHNYPNKTPYIISFFALKNNGQNAIFSEMSFAKVNASNPCVHFGKRQAGKVKPFRLDNGKEEAV